MQFQWRLESIRLGRNIMDALKIVTRWFKCLLCHLYSWFFTEFRGCTFIALENKSKIMNIVPFSACVIWLVLSNVIKVQPLTVNTSCLNFVHSPYILMNLIVIFFLLHPIDISFKNNFPWKLSIGCDLRQCILQNSWYYNVNIYFEWREWTKDRTN